MPLTLNQLKLSLAQAFTAVMKAVGYNVVLGGGGAATVLVLHRDIKDLDFKMIGQLKVAWRDQQRREEIIEAIEAGLKGYGYVVDIDDSNVQYVLRMTVRDRLSGLTADLSLTATGTYSRQDVQRIQHYPGQLTAVASPALLILDKAFALCGRSAAETDKLYTDFLDLGTLLVEHGVPIDGSGLPERWQAYRKKHLRDKKNFDLHVGKELLRRLQLVLGAMSPWNRLQLGIEIRKVMEFAVELDREVARQRLLESDIAFRERRAQERLAQKSGGSGGGSVRIEIQPLPQPSRPSSSVGPDWAALRQRVAELKIREARLRAKGRTKNSEYLYVTRRLFDIWLEYGID